MGYEMEIMNLLMTIDASRQQARHATRANKHSTKSGSKGSRELKNLISNINYDAGSSKCKITTGIGCWLFLNESENLVLEC